MGLKERLRRAEREAEADMVMVLQLDGSVKRFPKRAMLEALSRTRERGRAHSAGEIESAPPPHPFTVALQNAPEDTLEALLEKEGWGWVSLSRKRRCTPVGPNDQGRR